MSWMLFSFLLSFSSVINFVFFYLQLIQPKLQNKQKNPPETTSHASMPPSGNDLGSFGFNGCLSGSAFSTSSGFMSVMGMERAGSIISMLCFHSDANVAEDGVLVELIMIGIIFGVERRWKP